MSFLTIQTVNRDSLLTRLDFRSKLFMMVVLTAIAFMWESFVMEVLLAIAVLLACLFAGVKPGYIRKIILLMIPFYLLLIVTQGFFAEDLLRSKIGQTDLTPFIVIPEKWWLVGGAMMSIEGIEYALSVILKTLTMTLVIPLAIFTTDVNTMIVGLVKMHIPYKIAFIFSSTLRFFPLLLEEIQSIIEAQQLRGLAFERLRPVKRVRLYASIAVPLILGALTKSQMLEVVLQSKAFSGSQDRTYLHESKLSIGDYSLFVFFTLFYLISVLTYLVWGVGRFRGPI